MPPPTAFLFAGQGGEHVGMASAISDRCASCAVSLRRPDQVLGIPLWALMEAGPEGELHRTEHAQPAILAASVAAARHVIAREGRPAALLGHSVGQYAALVCAGAIQLDDALRLVHRRGRLMQAAVPLGMGAMAVILRIPRAQVEEVCAAAIGVVVVACHNATDETVVAGETAAVEEVADRCDDAGATVMVLPASAPFHSPLLRPMLPEFAAVLDTIELADPEIPVIDNVTARPLTRAGEVRRSLYEQIEAPVLFEEGLRELASRGIRRYIGCGPGKTVLRLARAADLEAETLVAHELGDLDGAHP